MHKKQRIIDVASIQSGYSFRKSIKEEVDGNMSVISAKDLKNNFYIYQENLIKINHPIYEEKIVKENDVLLSNRMYFKSSVLNFDGNVIGSSSLYILKPRKDIIISEYLAIWLNSSKGQNNLERNTTGSTIKTILKSDLENMQIDLPTVEEQKKIVELHKITEGLKEKYKKKVENIGNIFQGTLTKLIK